VRPSSRLWAPELRRSIENLLVHKLRTLLTMLGMIFGVAAVLSMLSIGAGAQQQVMAFIEDLGVRNIIVEARETTDYQANQKIRQQSPGLSFKDLRAIEAAIPGVDMLTPRKRFAPGRMVPKPDTDVPTVYGVEPNYQQIAGLRVTEGRFFTNDEAARAAAVCVLGEAARWRLFGEADPVGRFVKVNDQWFEVIGVVGPKAVAQSGVAGLPAQDRNNMIYAPTSAAMLRLEDNYSNARDEIDGIFVRISNEADISAASAITRGILDTVIAAPRLHAGRSGGAAGGAAAHQAHLRHRDGRWPQSRCWSRHRHHEHHAGERHGTHAGDRLRRAIGATRIDVIRQFVSRPP
jgi:putative ABC transport system permease protein